MDYGRRWIAAEDGWRGWMVAEDGWQPRMDCSRKTDCAQGWIIAEDGWQPRMDGSRGWIANGAMGEAVAIDVAMAMDGAMCNKAAGAIAGGVAFDGYRWSHGNGRCHGRIELGVVGGLGGCR